MTLKLVFEDFPREEILEYLKMIQEASELKEKTRWIPATEKLPEKECDCLVTTYRHGCLEVVSCSYYPDMRSKWFLDGGGDSKNVIAWMPLPDPYKESEENSKSKKSRALDKE